MIFRKSSQVKSSQVKSSQVKSSQVKSSQVKYYNMILKTCVIFITLNSFCAYADQINIGGYGGVNYQVQTKVWYDVYENSTSHLIGNSLINGDVSKIKDQIKTGKERYNLVELNSIDVTRACDQGILERISFADFDLSTKALINGAVNACGVGFVVFSTVLAYHQNHVAYAPKSWSDFWDVKNIPGKRGLQKTALYNLEFALMADGVPSEDVYKVLATQEGQDRAFAKLDQLKPHIVWWDNNASILQQLENGTVVMSSSFSGRINAQRKQQGINFIWHDAIYDMDYWAIPKGASAQDAVKDFIKFTLQVKNQQEFAKAIEYGITRRMAMNNLEQEIKDRLPTNPENMKQQLAVNVFFWADYGEQLEQRFKQWLKQ